MDRGKRSELMRKIKSRNTLPERIFMEVLRKQGIGFKAWPDLPGHPDFLIMKLYCVVFVHGCFWHGCKRHYREPRSNIEFWRNKISNNIKRHERNVRVLKRMGYSVITMWEHDLR